MFNSKGKTAQKVFTIFLGVVLLFCLAGCSDELAENENEYGFVESIDRGCVPDLMYRCAYRLNETEFHKNNVTVEVFYGHFSFATLPDNSDDPYDPLANIVFRLYFVSGESSYPLNAENAYFIKEVRYYEFYSAAYSMSCEEHKNKVRYMYAHSEVLQIPPELFIEPKGEIAFIFRMYDPIDNAFYSGKSFRVYYRVNGDTVTLSVPR